MNPRDRIKVELMRNRSEIEATISLDGQLMADRLPVSWRSRNNTLDYLSVSKMDLYQRCPGKFFRQYIMDQGMEDDGGNIFTQFGTILHEVTEKMYGVYAATGICPRDPIPYYDEACKVHGTPDFSMYKEGREVIVDYFKRNPIDRVMYEAFIIDGKPSVEYEWRGQFADIDDIPFGLMFDFIGKINEQVGIIKDYKSNRMPYTQYELADSIQLGTYEVVARQLFPHIEKWVTGYDLFRFGWQPCPERTEADLEAIRAYVRNIWYMIKNDNTWEEKLNDYCGYCQYNYSCNKYQRFVTDPKKFIVSAYETCDKTDMASIERTRQMLVTYEKIAKTRKDELGAIVKAGIESAIRGGNKLIIDGDELQLYSNPTESYRYHDVRQTLMVHGELGILDDCLSISKKKLDDSIASKPNLALALSNCKSTSYASPYIVRKKAK